MRATPLLVLVLTLPPAATAAEPAQLVEQLADKRFRVREAAAKALIELGVGAKPALQAGTKHADPEAADRCKQLLDHLANRAFNAALDELTRDPKSVPSKELLGAERFLAASGDTPEARELYVEVLTGQKKLFSDIAADEKSASAKFTKYCQEVYERTKYLQGVPSRADNITRGEVATFLFLAGDDRLGRTSASYVMYYPFINGPKMVALCRGRPRRSRSRTFTRRGWRRSRTRPSNSTPCGWPASGG